MIDQESYKIPSFPNVKERDKNKLLLEVCYRIHHFDRINFFSSLPCSVWTQFIEQMEKRIYLEGELVYDSGSAAAHFYVIKSGSVWFTMNNSEFNCCPFVETNSYFGELELFDGSPRKWAVSAKSKLVVFTIPKNEFLKLFIDHDIRLDFFETMIQRY